MGLLSDSLNGAPSAGRYMQGGFFSKAMDLLGTGGFASAGAADALLKGENPIQGAIEGVQDRRSYIDVLKDRGVPGPIATGAGIVGDFVLDPFNLATGGLAKMAKAADMAHVLAAGDHVAKELTTAEEVIKRVGQHLPFDASADAAAMLHHGRAQAARDAYYIAKGAGSSEEAAVNVAKRAAKSYNPTSKQLSELERATISSAKFGPASSSAAGPWMNALNHLKSRLVQRVGVALREDFPAFGGHGVVAAKAMEHAELIAQTLGADRMASIYRPVMALLKTAEDREALTFFLHGVGDASDYSEHVLKAGDHVRRGLDMIHADMVAAGIKRTDSVLTCLYSRLNQEQRIAVSAMLEHPETINAESGVGRLAQKISEVKGKIVLNKQGMATIETDLLYRDFFAPIYETRKSQGRVAGMEDFRNALEAEMLRHDPTITAAEARRVVEAHLSDAWLAPNDIRRSFQYGRLANGLPKEFEKDPRVWLAKYLKDSSDRLAQAHAWGGQDQTAKLLAENIRAEGGDVERFERLIRLANGQERNPMQAYNKLAGRLSDVLFLGPGTAILQATQGANAIGKFGPLNAIAATVEYLRNPAARQMAEDLGVTMPSLYHAIDGGALDKTMQTWHRILGIQQADKAVRGISAIAAALHASELGRGLVKAHGLGNLRAVERLTQQMAEFGVAAEDVLKQGGKLNPDQLASFMIRGANTTNFTSSISSLPEVFRGPAGQFFLKFKSYSFQQGYFINDLVKTARAGDLRPLLQYAALFPWTYARVFTAMNALKRKPIDTEDDWAMLKNMLMTGALGFWGDTALSLGSSESLWLGAVAGPNAAAIGNLGRGLVQPFVQGDPSKLGDLPQEVGLVRQGKALWENTQ